MNLFNTFTCNPNQITRNMNGASVDRTICTCMSTLSCIDDVLLWTHICNCQCLNTVWQISAKKHDSYGDAAFIFHFKAFRSRAAISSKQFKVSDMERNEMEWNEMSAIAAECHDAKNKDSNKSLRHVFLRDPSMNLAFSCLWLWFWLWLLVSIA